MLKGFYRRFEQKSQNMLMEIILSQPLHIKTGNSLHKSSLATGDDDNVGSLVIISTLYNQRKQN